MATQTKAQDLRTHARIDAAYHYALLPLFALNVLICAWHLYRRPDWFSGWLTFLAVVMMVLVFKVRTYPLKVQDRIIRLEERIRLQALLPASLHPRIHELSEQQLIALRFAADEEIPELVRKTLDGDLPPKEIKKLIQNWRPDHYRV